MTENIQSPLREKAISGMFWTFSQQFLGQIINFGAQVVLARILLPAHFGLIAMLQIFIAIGQSLIDGGMTSSIIRSKTVDNVDYSSVFFINVSTSVLIYALCFASSPYVADFYRSPVLTDLIRVYALSFILQAFVGVQTARLTRLMNFRLQMMMEIPSIFIGGAVGVFCAYRGFGVWSLVWAHLVRSFIFMIQHWMWTDWRPVFVIDREKLKYHFAFGYKLTFSGILSSIYVNSYNIVIGRFFQADVLGFYNQANTMRMFPVTNLTFALQKVTYPLFSKIQDDNARLLKAFKSINKLVFFIVTPLMAVLILFAEPIFELILTAKWLPAVPYFQILCISAIIYPLSMYNLNIISAKGRTDLHFKMEIIKKIPSFILLLALLRFGIWGIIWASVANTFIHALINAIFSGRIIGYSVRDQALDLLPLFGIAAVVFVVVYFIDIRLFIHLNSALRIIVGTICYFLFYSLIAHYTRISTFQEVKQLIQDGRVRKRQD